MKNSAFFTIVSRNYIPYAITLCQSIERQYPNSKIFVAISDECNTNDISLFTERVKLIDIDALNLPSKFRFLFRYDVMELSTGIKPYVFKYIFNTENFDQVIYLDPDIYLCSPLEELSSLFSGGANIVLTPHLLSPIEDDCLPNELGIMRAGAYNLGFLGVSRSEQGFAMLRWWAQRLEKDGINDLDKGLFTDQKWMDLVPGLFGGVSLLKKPSYNLAYWNLGQRYLSLDGNGFILANGCPLRFVHFSGVDPLKPMAFSKHQNRFNLNSIGLLKSMYLEYLDQLIANGYENYIKIQNKYSLYENGEIIDKAMRVYFRNYLDEGAINNPFKELNREYFKAAPDDLTNKTILSKYLVGFQEATLDLRMRSCISGADYEKSFLKHMNQGMGYINYKVPEEFRMPIHEDLQINHINRYQDLSSSFNLKVIKGKVNTFLYNLYLRNKKIYRLIKFFIPIKIIFKIIHGSIYHNTDLQILPISEMKYNLALDFNKKLTWSELLKNKFSFLNKNYFRGVSLIGYIRGDFGVAQNARAVASSLKSSNTNFSILALTAKDTHTESDHSFDQYVSIEKRYAVRLLCLNADQTAAFNERLIKFFGSWKGHTIGNWFWELPTFPDPWRDSLDAVDELWAPSKFIEHALNKWTNKKVVHMPVAVEFSCNEKFDREYFLLPRDKFCFLFSYDFYSFSSRKNPESVLKAFNKAFKLDDDRVRLVMKVSYSDKKREEFNDLLKLVACDPRIIIIDKLLSREEMYGLLNSCDSYISLHRSEGFGLGLAESMYLGKPVIGTAYSGNMDFMNSENSYLVDFKLVPVPEGAYPFWENQVWADPDVESAAQGMAKILGDIEFRLSIAKKGQKTIKEKHSFDYVGSLMNVRLKQIYKNL
jgi:glycosyltransferase involved in cell wall biosynthesis